MTWEDVESSGAVTPTFDERVRHQFERNREDPEAFVDAVQSIARFRSDNAQRLRDHFEEHGLINAVDALPFRAIVDRAQRECGDDIGASVLQLIDVERLVEIVWRVTGLDGCNGPSTSE